MCGKGAKICRSVYRILQICLTSKNPLLFSVGIRKPPAVSRVWMWDAAPATVSHCTSDRDRWTCKFRPRSLHQSTYDCVMFVLTVLKSTYHIINVLAFLFLATVIVPLNGRAWYFGLIIELCNRFHTSNISARFRCLMRLATLGTDTIAAKLTLDKAIWEDLRSTIEAAVSLGYSEVPLKERYHRQLRQWSSVKLKVTHVHIYLEYIFDFVF